MNAGELLQGSSRAAIETPKMAEIVLERLSGGRSHLGAFSDVGAQQQTVLFRVNRAYSGLFRVLG
jgi:hypothetical protein